MGTMRTGLALRPHRHAPGTRRSYLARPKGFEPLTSAVGLCALSLPNRTVAAARPFDYEAPQAPVAQLDRALPSEGGRD